MLANADYLVPHSEIRSHVGNRQDCSVARMPDAAVIAASVVSFDHLHLRLIFPDDMIKHGGM